MNLECRGCIWLVKIYDKRTPIHRVIFALLELASPVKKERKKEGKKERTSPTGVDRIKSPATFDCDTGENRNKKAKTTLKHKNIHWYAKYLAYQLYLFFFYDSRAHAPK